MTATETTTETTYEIFVAIDESGAAFVDGELNFSPISCGTFSGDDGLQEEI